MNRIEKASRVGAVVVITLLMTFGALAMVAVPFIAASLASQYSEYASDIGTITALLVTPVIFSETLLAIILVLLRRIRIDQILTPRSESWVRALTYNAGALSLSFLAILVWLANKNTLPPSVALLLLIALLLPLAVAMVTRTLLGLLRRATTANEELEGVV